MKAETYDTIIAALKRLPGGAIEFDAELEKQYALVLRAMPSATGLAVLRRVIAECEFRPAAAVLVRFAREHDAAQSDSLENLARTLPPAQAAGFRIVTAPPRNALPSLAEGPGREKARVVIAQLAERMAGRRDSSGNEFANVPVSVLDDLADRKRRNDAARPETNEPQDVAA